MSFDLNQAFDIVFTDDKVKKAKLTIEAQIVGLLRGDKHGGSASVCNGAAAVALGTTSIVSLSIEGHAVAGADNLSINDRDGPCTAPIGPGKYRLHQAWHVSAQHPMCVLPCKAASAEFAPDPALDPLWISYWEPFHGAQKKDFGFQVTIKVGFRIED